jgi:arsenate reductase-like glutaredoxin family protein
MQNKIKFVLYTRPNCHFCDLTKAWLENTGAKEKIE